MTTLTVLALMSFMMICGRVKYIKKLFTRFEQTGELKHRLILNHIITLNNVFGPSALIRIIFFRMKKQLHYVKPFLVMLNILPEIVQVGPAEYIITDDIPLDATIIQALRSL
jgi:hypothetical protein